VQGTVSSKARQQVPDLTHVSFAGIDPAIRARVRRLPLFRPVVRFPQLDGERRVRNEARVTIDPFIEWLFAAAGLESKSYRGAALQRRLPACLRQLRVENGAAARELIERKPELMPKAMNALLIGVSEFFRDSLVFERLRTVLLPMLLKERRSINVCAAGVSNGQELYSIAILLAEAGALEGSQLLGVDVRREAIACAQMGRFTGNDLAGMNPDFRERYFRQVDSSWVVRDELRARIRWRVADLFTQAPGGWYDLILFRNVSIYFEPERALRVWERLRDELAPGGCLVTGKAEVPPQQVGLRRTGQCIYRKTENT
jgi:chemotaxis protein methyltransferase CheR